MRSHWSAIQTIAAVVANLFLTCTDSAMAFLPSNSPRFPSELAHSTAVCTNRVTNGGNCSVLLDVPPVCSGSTSDCPVAIFYHGHGGSNEMFTFGVSPLVHRYGFIGVYPQGALYNGRSGWNDGSFGPELNNNTGGGDRCHWNQFNCTVDPNDGLWSATIIAVVNRLGSTGRWYAFGESNGANEVQILAANAVIHFDALPLVAIAANSGQMLAAPLRSAPSPYNYNQPCAGKQPCGTAGPGRGMAQLSLHGTADPVIPYHGGPRFQSPTFILMDEFTSDMIWAKQNNCTAALHNETVSASQHGRNTTAVHSSWIGCPATTPVELYSVIGTGHLAADTIRGEDVMVTVMDFFVKVEKGHGGKLPTPPPPPPPGPPPFPRPVPPAKCKSCVLTACGSVRSNHATCTECMVENRMLCARACVPYPYDKTLDWLCGSSKS